MDPGAISGPGATVVGHDDFDAARAAGREMPLADAIARARTQAGNLRR